MKQMKYTETKLFQKRKKAYLKDFDRDAYLRELREKASTWLTEESADELLKKLR